MPSKAKNGAVADVQNAGLQASVVCSPVQQLPGGVDAVEELSSAITDATHSEQMIAFKSDMSVTLQKHWKEAQSELELLYDRHFECCLSQVAHQQPRQARELPPKSAWLPANTREGPSNVESTAPPPPVAPPQVANGTTRPDLDIKKSMYFELEMEKRYVNTLKQAFQEQAKDRIEKVQSKKEDMYTVLQKKKDSCDIRLVEQLLDATIGFLICLNAIVLGIQLDSDADDDSAGWLIVDICFSILYCFEVVLKVYIHGLRGHFCGQDKLSHIFDACLIFIDIIQLVLSLIPAVKDSISDAPSASLLRVVRLAKITRLLRLLRSAVFQDLLAMMHGMAGGMQTLFWSMILFVGVVYVVSLIFHESLGQKGEGQTIEHVSDMFDTVPRSMYTTFRCSFGDCSSPDGVPVFEHVARYSYLYTFIYCFFLFIVTIGLFNVISAIFLEATMAAAIRLGDEKKQARLVDGSLWLKCTYRLMTRLSDIWNKDFSFEDLLDKSISEIQSVFVPRDAIDKWSADEQVLAILEDLDVDPHDSQYLSDILDPDNNGFVTVIELLDGLRRLRGFTRRSDILTVDLMVRSIQRDVHQILYRMSAG